MSSTIRREQEGIEPVRHYLAEVYGLVLRFLSDRGLRDSDNYALRVANVYYRWLDSGDSKEQRLAAVAKVVSPSVFSGIGATKSALTEDLVEYLDSCLCGRPMEEALVVDSVASEARGLQSDADLHRAVVALVLRFKTRIESTGLWQAFWDERSMQPKREPSIQPTMLALLREAFRDHGIEILRETHEGVGLLDFRCTASLRSQVFNTCIELKLAHHSEIEQGLIRQLVAYMDSVGSSFGVYLVLWFKDQVNWNDPSTYSDPGELQSRLLSLAAEQQPKTISVIVVDVTRKSPASKRR